LNIATSYQLTENLSIFGRVENVLDADYEEVAGFGTAEISFYGGLKLSF
jgi:vitamin B12 transporter